MGSGDLIYSEIIDDFDSTNDASIEAQWWQLRQSERECLEDIVWGQDVAVLEKYIDQLKTAFQSERLYSTNGDNTFVASRSLNCFDIIRATIRLVQVLLRSSKRRTPPTPNSTIGLTEERAIQTSIQLIKNLGQTLELCLQEDNSKQHQNSLKTSEQQCQVAVFALETFLRVFDSNVLYSSIMMVPIVWRQICAIAKFLHRWNSLEFVILDLSVKGIMALLTDMESHTRMVTAVIFSQPQLGTDQPNYPCLLQNNLKMLLFLTSCLESLILLVTPVQYSDPRFKALELEMIALVCKLRGIENILKICPCCDFSSILSEFTKLTVKIDNFFEKLIFLCSNGNTHEVMNETTRLTSWYTTVNYVMSKVVSSKVVISNQTQVDEAILESVSLSIGIIYFFMKILRQLTLALIFQHNDRRRYQLSVDLELAICEHLIFTLSPLCQVWIINTDSLGKSDVSHETDSLLMEMIGCIVECTLSCERSVVIDDFVTNDIAMIQFILLQWLSISSSEINPISLEMMLVIIHMHVIRSDFCGHSRNNNANISTLPFLQLLTRVFFDTRTNTQLRKNISIIFHRLLSCQGGCDVYDSEEILERTSSRAEQVLLDCLFNGASLSAGRKRRRIDSRQSYSLENFTQLPMEDLKHICFILEALAFRDRFWLDIKGSSVSYEFVKEGFDVLREPVKCVKEILNVGEHENYGVRKETADKVHKTLITLALLPGSMVSSVAPSILEWHDAYHSCAELASSMLESDMSPVVQTVASAILDAIHTYSRRRKDCIEFRYMKKILVSAAKQTKVGMQPFSVMFQIASLLTLFTLPMELSIDSLSLISHHFTAVLGSCHWPISLGSMKYLERFASVLPAIHVTLLPSCVPLASQLLFQSRLRGGNAFLSSMKNMFGIRFTEHVLISQHCSIKKNMRETHYLEVNIPLVIGSKVFTIECTRDVGPGIIIIPPYSSSDFEKSFFQSLRPSWRLHESTLSRISTNGCRGANLVLMKTEK